MVKKAIWWIRRDIRLDDNPALLRAADLADLIIPLVIIDEEIMRCDCPQRITTFLFAVRNLYNKLKENGGQLIIRRGNPKKILPSFIEETGACVVSAEEDYSQFSRSRDDSLKHDIPLELVSGLTIHHPLAVKQTNGKPYTVFTAFKNAWKKLPFPFTSITNFSPKKIISDSIESDSIPNSSESSNLLFTEANAQSQLQNFLYEKAGDYGKQRDYPGEKGTSLLSTCFRFGVLSPRIAVQSALDLLRESQNLSSQGLELWMDELIWRDFFHAITYHFPYVQQMAFRENWRKFKWNESEDDFDMWRNGETGYPIVDAGMRQLAATGWMHNRVRMITASFLVKDLMINWQKGEQWFMKKLVDGDPAVNNGNWQWVAGCGTDAAPYFRIFNPTTQGQKYDANGDYIRSWIPELKNVPNAYIHTPWLMPSELQNQTKTWIGKTYSKPVVDHAQARLRFIEQVKNQTSRSGY